MKFSERLKALREQKNLTQVELAQKAGISVRMIQNYEIGCGHPRYSASEKLAYALEIPVSELLGENESMVAKASEQYGNRGARQAKELVDEVSGLFAGGDLAEEDMDVMMKAIQDAYWIAKEKNRKYSSKSNGTQNNKS